MLVLLQVFVLFISSSFCSTGFAHTPAGDGIAHVSGQTVGPVTRGPVSHVSGQPPVPADLKEWLNHPKNMAKMWAVTKMSINAIPAPKSLQELEYLLMTMGSIVSQKLALLKALAGGKPPNLQNKLESLGHNPDRGLLYKLLNANSAPHLHQLMKEEGL